MTGPECPDCAEMDSDADTSPPDFTATTLTGIIDDEEDPEGAWLASHKTRAGARTKTRTGKRLNTATTRATRRRKRAGSSTRGACTV